MKGSCSKKGGASGRLRASHEFLPSFPTDYVMCQQSMMINNGCVGQLRHQQAMHNKLLKHMMKHVGEEMIGVLKQAKQVERNWQRQQSILTGGIKHTSSIPSLFVGTNGV
jgi:hypothetical protein